MECEELSPETSATAEECPYRGMKICGHRIFRELAYHSLNSPGGANKSGAR